MQIILAWKEIKFVDNGTDPHQREDNHKNAKHRVGSFENFVLKTQWSTKAQIYMNVSWHSVKSDMCHIVSWPLGIGWSNNDEIYYCRFLHEKKGPYDSGERCVPWAFYHFITNLYSTFNLRHPNDTTTIYAIALCL
jgi:hypothetical protein